MNPPAAVPQITGADTRPLAPQRKAPLEKCGAGVKGRGLAYPALFGRFSFGWRAQIGDHVFGRAVWQRFVIQPCGLLRGRKVCTGDVWRWRRSSSWRAFAVGRTIAHTNPPAAVPQITGADT